MMICYRRVRMRKPATLEEPSRSAQVVASSADLLTELLLRLPVKSQLKFKCVCRRWLLLITDPHFIRRKCLISNTVSGLYLDCYSLSERCICYEFVPLDASQKRATFQYLTFAGYPHGIRILQSCNGLLLCRSVGGDLEYFVYNPATKQFKALPLIPRRAGKRVFGFSLAFDPSISLSYKVICITGRKFSRAGCRLLIYSSETVGWRVSGAPFTAPLDVEFDEARVYWNGAIHWFSMTDTSLYFDLSEELVLQMPMPPPPLEYSDEKRHRYFGESFGHLHLVDSYSERLTTELIVYEMERDRSGWFVKFRLDQDVFASSTSPFYPIKVLCVAREEKEEDSFMVVHISDATNSNDVKVIRHNFISQTQKVICDSDFLGLHPWLPVVQYIENLSLV